MGAAPEASLEAAPAAARGRPLRRSAGAAELSQLAGRGGRLAVRSTLLHLQAPRGHPPSSSGAEWRTSVPFRNVPYLLTRDMLVELLDAHGFQAWPVKSQKKCSVGWSNRQGLQSNLAVYRKLSVMKGSAPEAWKPALFLRGSQ
ncbi:unnamed protein product, partial [Prorocentrum cordatum]